MPGLELSIISTVFFSFSAFSFEIRSKIEEGALVYGKINKGKTLFLEDKKIIPTPSGFFFFGLPQDSKEITFTLFDETGKKTEFEQIAVVHLEEHLCVILKPVVKLPGMGDNEALVFVIEERDNEEYLYVSEDNELIDEVFAQYYEMLRNAGVDIS